MSSSDSSFIRALSSVLEKIWIIFSLIDVPIDSHKIFKMFLWNLLLLCPMFTTETLTNRFVLRLPLGERVTGVRFDVFCDLLLSRRTATSNLFVLYNKKTKCWHWWRSRQRLNARCDEIDMEIVGGMLRRVDRWPTLLVLRRWQNIQESLFSYWRVKTCRPLSLQILRYKPITP